MIKSSLIMLLTIISLVSCSKEEGGTLVTEQPTLQMPAATQTGANTFGCYINGKLLVPRNGSGTIGGADRGATLWGGYPNNTDYYEIDIRDYKSNRTAQILIHLQAAHLNGVGNYIVDLSNGMSNIDGLNHHYIHCRVFNEATNSYQYYRSFDNSGLINITNYNFNNRLLSGSFSCKVRNSVNASDEIEITQGRFDLKWDTLSDKVFP